MTLAAAGGGSLRYQYLLLLKAVRVYNPRQISPVSPQRRGAKVIGGRAQGGGR